MAETPKYMADFSLPTEEFLAQHDKIMDGELSAILRGKLVPPGAGNFGRNISRYEDLWEETSRKPPMPFQPRRSTFWDPPLASQRPSLMRSDSPNLPAQDSEFDEMMPCQSPAGAERLSSKPSQLAIWPADLPMPISAPTQYSRMWNPMVKENCAPSSLDAPRMGVPSLSPARTLAGATDEYPSPSNSSAENYPSPEPQQITYEPHSAPTHTRHDMRLAVVPTATELLAPCPFQAPNSRSVPTEPRFLDYANSTLQAAVLYPPVQLGPAQSYSVLTSPNPPQQPVTSAMNGLASAARALLRWRIKNPNAGPVRQVSSQSTFSIQEQTRHQGGLEFRKRKEKEEVAMRAGRAERAGLWQRR